MPGALLQLVAIGPQDEYLTASPQYSYFKHIQRCHTNFAMESIPQSFDTDPGSNKRMSAKIQRQGDLLMGLNLHIHFINKTNPATLSVSNLPRRLGMKVIDYVELQIGQTPIDRMYGNWMDLWGQLTNSTADQEKLYRLVSGRELDYDDDKVYITGTTPDPLAPGKSGTVAIIPLPFWFSRNPGLALPLVALQFNDVECVVQLRPLHCLVPSSKMNTIEGMTIDGMELYADFLFLDTNERREFASKSHSYLIEQTQFNQISSLSIDMGTNTTTAMKHNEQLRFSHPVKELFWIVKRLQNPSAPRDEYDYFSQDGTDMVINAEIQVNGASRECQRNGLYYRLEQPYKYHSGGEQQDSWENKVANVTTELGGFYVHSFALEPESVMPSGTMNFSRLDSATLKLSLHPSADTLEVYARNYNVLRVSQGMGGLVYSN